MLAPTIAIHNTNFMKAKKHLIEVGFMGAGKTTVGRAVAGELGLPFYDTDQAVVQTTGKPIAEIFAGNGGEAEFRKLELAALLEILENEPGIVSTGGGIVSTELGRKALMNCEAQVVLLKLSFEATKQRVINDAGPKRPLFNDPAKAFDLYNARELLYQRVATHTIDASQPIEQVVADIIGITKLNTALSEVT